MASSTPALARAPDQSDPAKKFAKKLAANEVKVRNSALKNLKKYISIRSKSADFEELELLKLWKGLYFCMWMADKPLVQEDVADRMVTLLDDFHTLDQAVAFLKAFYTTIYREWTLIDRLRLDKFMMLLRKYFRGTLEFVKKHKWNTKLLEDVRDCLMEGPLNPTGEVRDGIQCHLGEVFMPELKAVADHSLTPKVLDLLLDPYLHLISKTKSASVLEALKVGLFDAMKRTVDTGIQMKRKGQETKFTIDCTLVSEKLLEYAINKDTMGRNRKTLYELKKSFQELSLLQKETDHVEVASTNSLSSRDETDGESSLKAKRKKKEKVLKHLQPSPQSPLDEEEGEPKLKEKPEKRKKRKTTKKSSPSNDGNAINTLTTPLTSNNVEKDLLVRSNSSSEGASMIKTTTSNKKDKGKSSKMHQSDSNDAEKMNDQFQMAPIHEAPPDPLVTKLFEEDDTGDWNSEGQISTEGNSSISPIATRTRKRLQKTSLEKKQTSKSDQTVHHESPAKKRKVEAKSKKRVSFVPSQNALQKFNKSFPVTPHVKRHLGGTPSSVDSPTKSILKTPDRSKVNRTTHMKIIRE